MAPAAGTTAHRPAVRSVLADHRFVAATALNGVLYLYMPVLSVLLPLWTAERTDAPLWTVAAVFVLNTAGVALTQRRVVRTVTDLRTAGRAVLGAGLLLAVGTLVLAAAAHTSGPTAALAVLLAAGAVLTAGEVVLAAGSWEIGFGLADPDRAGQWQGFYSTGVPAARALGPTALVALAWTGPGLVVLAGAFAVAGGMLARVAGRPARARL